MGRYNNRPPSNTTRAENSLSSTNEELNNSSFFNGIKENNNIKILPTNKNLNPNEISQLNIEDDNTIPLLPKTNKNRIIIMNDTLYDILLNYKNSQMKYKDFKDSWFVFGVTTPISKTTSDRKRIEYFDLSGVKPITNHQFRHSLTTILIQEHIKNQQLNNVKIDKYAFLSALANRNSHTVETMIKNYANLFPDT